MLGFVTWLWVKQDKKNNSHKRCCSELGVSNLRLTLKKHLSYTLSLGVRGWQLGFRENNVIKTAQPLTPVSQGI